MCIFGLGGTSFVCFCSVRFGRKHHLWFSFIWWCFYGGFLSTLNESAIEWFCENVG